MKKSMIYNELGEKDGAGKKGKGFRYQLEKPEALTIPRRNEI